MLIYQLPNPYVQQHARVEELSGAWLLNNFVGNKTQFSVKNHTYKYILVNHRDLHTIQLKD